MDAWPVRYKFANPSCPHCGRSMPYERHGVMLTYLKSRIFDLVRTRPAISAAQIAEEIYGEAAKGDCHNIKSHVNQINDLFAGTDIRIVGKQYSGYRIKEPRDSNVSG